MSFHVQRKVVTARETPLANFAFERLCTRVLPIMARQLVRPGEEHEQSNTLLLKHGVKLYKDNLFSDLANWLLHSGH